MQSPLNRKCTESRYCIAAKSLLKFFQYYASYAMISGLKGDAGSVEAVRLGPGGRAAYGRQGRADGRAAAAERVTARARALPPLNVRSRRPRARLAAPHSQVEGDSGPVHTFAIYLELLHPMSFNSRSVVAKCVGSLCVSLTPVTVPVYNLYLQILDIRSFDYMLFTCFRGGINSE